MIIAFSVVGTPVAKPRMTKRDKWAKRPCVMKYWAWCDLVRFAYKKQAKRAYFNKCKIDYLIHYTGKKALDGSNIEKGIEDALNGLAWPDDNHKILREGHWKFADNPVCDKVEIIIEEG